MMRARSLDAALLLIGGGLYAAALPPHQWSACAWVALVPLLAVAERASRRGAFAAGFVYGALFFTATVAWVVEAVSSYFATGILGALAFSSVICLVYVSVYVGLFGLAVHQLLARGRWRALIGLPALWVAYELARATLFTGLPWEMLGHSQWKNLPLIQVADLAGAYAVSFMVAAVNVGAYLVLRDLARTAEARRLVHAAAPLGAALALVAAVATYGIWRIGQESTRPMTTSRVLTLVQGNQVLPGRWERAGAERSLLVYAGLTQRAVAEQHPDLVVWPEYAVTLYPERDPVLLSGLREIARRVPAGLVFGAPRAERLDAHPRYFNSAYYVAPDGTVAASDKIRLVPFAEYRPLSFGEAIAADDEREFTAGTRSTVFASPAGRLGVLICYEVIFPGMARDLVRAGAEVLLNLSNDGWLDRAGLGAGAQHLSMAVFRAVETRRYLARVASTGISGFIDPLGRPFALLGANLRGVTSGEVQPRQEMTPYVRYGDAFAFACVCVGLATLRPSARRRGAP